MLPWDHFKPIKSIKSSDTSLSIYGVAKANFNSYIHFGDFVVVLVTITF